MRRFALLAGVGMLVLLQASLAAGERETVRIGVCLSMTGDFAEYGRVYLPGVHLAVDDYNQREDRRYDLELIIRDDESDPVLSAAIAKELADQENVVAIIGSIASNSTLAMREETKKRNLVMITPSATSPVLGSDDDGVVRVLFNDEFQGEALARYAYDRLEFTRAAVLMNSRFEYSLSIGEAFAAHFAALGGSVHRETYAGGMADMEEFNFRPLLERILERDVQTVVVSSYAADVISILRQAQELGMTARFCGGDAWHHQETLLASGNAIEGAFYVSVMDEDSPTPENRRFKELLETTNYEADIVSAQAYDAVLILIEAMKNGAGREEIYNTVYTITDLPLVTGSITVRRGEGSLKPAFIVEIAKDDEGAFTASVVDVVKP